ncbi:unnamed protein product [Polarella glacialis]|uniref:TOG domain-containing protein n=1 Tax=Polarella glacialis TaxID=89957 RepID=A0A813FE18_POLGL|nr:unnamed protein product [Polarella glacialis]
MLPFFHILQDQAPFDSIQESYWPLYGKVKAQLRTNTPQAGEAGDEEPLGLLEKACKKALVFCKEQTDPLKRILVLYEEVPQLCAAVLFAVLGGSSVLSAAIGSVAFLKLLAIRFARKYILSFTAKWNIPWRGISSDDLQQACACEVVSWDIRARAVLELLTNGNPPTNVERQGVETLHELYNRYAADDEAKAAKVVKDATRLLVGMLHGRSAQEAQKTLEAFYGGYKHFPFIASAVQSFLDRKPEVVDRFADLTLADFAEKIQEFGRLGSPAAPFAADVAALLKDEVYYVRLAAVKALAALGPEAAGPFATDVAARLRDREEDVRHAAVEALAGFGSEAAGPFATDVAALLKDEVSYVRRAAVETLASLGPGLAAPFAADVAALLKDNNNDVRRAAVETLAAFGSEAAGPFATDVAALLKDEVFYVRQAAVKALAALGPEAAGPFAADVAALLRDRSEDVRQAAVEALAAFGSEAAGPFAADVAALLGDEDAEVRQAAVKALAALGPELVAPIATDVAALLKNGDWNVRRAAVTAFASLGPGLAAPSAADVAALLKDEYYEVRQAAVKALASLGPGLAAPFAADVAALLKDEAPFGSEAAGPFAADVAALLKDRHKEVRKAAVRLPALLKDEVFYVRQAAVKALAALGPEAAGPFAADVAALLRDREEVAEVRQAAVEALAALGPELGAPFATSVGRKPLLVRQQVSAAETAAQTWRATRRELDLRLQTVVQVESCKTLQLPDSRNRFTLPADGVTGVVMGLRPQMVASPKALTGTATDSRLGRSPVLKEENSQAFPVVGLLGEEVLQAGRELHVAREQDPDGAGEISSTFKEAKSEVKAPTNKTERIVKKDRPHLVFKRESFRTGMRPSRLSISEMGCKVLDKEIVEDQNRLFDLVEDIRQLQEAINKERLELSAMDKEKRKRDEAETRGGGDLDNMSMLQDAIGTLERDLMLVERDIEAHTKSLLSCDLKQAQNRNSLQALSQQGTSLRDKQDKLSLQIFSTPKGSSERRKLEEHLSETQESVNANNNTRMTLLDQRADIDKQRQLNTLANNERRKQREKIKKRMETVQDLRKSTKASSSGTSDNLVKLLQMQTIEVSEHFHRRPTESEFLTSMKIFEHDGALEHLDKSRPSEMFLRSGWSGSGADTADKYSARIQAGGMLEAPRAKGQEDDKEGVKAGKTVARKRRRRTKTKDDVEAGIEMWNMQLFALLILLLAGPALAPPTSLNTLDPKMGKVRLYETLFGAGFGLAVTMEELKKRRSCFFKGSAKSLGPWRLSVPWLPTKSRNPFPGLRRTAVLKSVVATKELLSVLQDSAVDSVLTSLSHSLAQGCSTSLSADAPPFVPLQSDYVAEVTSTYAPRWAPADHLCPRLPGAVQRADCLPVTVGSLTESDFCLPCAATLHYVPRIVMPPKLPERVEVTTSWLAMEPLLFDESVPGEWCCEVCDQGDTQTAWLRIVGGSLLCPDCAAKDAG